MMTFILRATLIVCLLVSGSLAWAEGLRLPQTRVVFDAKARSALAQIDNLSESVYLVSTQVVRSPAQTNAEPAPFVVTPPLFRLEPQSQYTVRIVPQGVASLPADRESVFYVSFLAIPSTPPSAETGDETTLSAQVSIGMNIVIKMFYRPSSLVMDVNQAEGKLTGSMTPQGLKLHNPTPYYLTLSALSYGGQSVDLVKDGAMIAPYSDKTFTVTPASGAVVSYNVINDYGGTSPQYPLTLSHTSSQLPSSLEVTP